MHILIHPLMGCHFSAKDAFPLSGAKLDFSLENKTNKMREERFHFKHLRYLNILRLLSSCLKFLCAACMHTKSLQLCLILSSPMGYSPPGSSACGILLAKILESAAMLSSVVSSRPRYQTHISYVFCVGSEVLYHEHHLRNPEVPLFESEINKDCLRKRNS